MIIQLGISARRRAKRKAKRKALLRGMRKYKKLMEKKPGIFSPVIKKAFVSSQRKSGMRWGFVPDIPGVRMTVPSMKKKLKAMLVPGVKAPVLRPLDVLKKKKTPYKRFKKLSGDRGVIQTVKMIRALVERFKKDIRIRGLAGAIVCPFKKNVEKITAVFNWVRDNIKYVRDIDGVETIHTPYRILRQGYGDCDDLALIAATLLKAVGYKVFYVVTSNRRDKRFNHIFLKVSDGKRKYNFDATIKTFDKARPGVTRKKILI